MNERKQIRLKYYLLGSVLLFLGTFLPLRLAMAACTISTTSVNFGRYSVFATAPLDSTGTVVYWCAGTGKNIIITLDRGSAPTFNPRQMLKGSAPLNYNLYLNASRTTIWGDGTGGSEVFSDPNPLPDQPRTVVIYGRIPARQNLPAGFYSDSIIVTVIF